jgi:group II intron reverse transcriptase/maturase
MEEGTQLLKSPTNEREGLLMHPDSLRRRLESIPTLSQEGRRIDGLYRLMLSHRLLWQQAYISLAPNKGAVTPGIDARNTLDGHSAERVERIIAALADGSYRFTPVRRVYIPKATGGERPLGVPSADDKLVQEVARRLLEAIYEPVFSTDSHGFRPGRSCHTALDQIQHTWTGVKWMVDLDISGFYDNIDHKILVALLERKIDDKRFIKLIKGMLAAGYVEDWKFHRTYSGTPQGGVISPTLANVYLHELDRFIADRIAAFNRGVRRHTGKDYQRYSSRIFERRKKIDRLKREGGSSEAIQALRQEIRRFERERSKFPSRKEMDPEYQRMLYCRYADDFLIGVIGSKQEAEQAKLEAQEFLRSELALEVSVEKSGVHHANNGVEFLGYRVRIWGKRRGGRQAERATLAGRHLTRRTKTQNIQLAVPEHKVRAFNKRKGYGNLDQLQSTQRGFLTPLSDVEIVMAYNGEMRGLANYYRLAWDVKRALNRLYYLWWGSLLRTLAMKHKTTVSKAAKHLRTPDGEFVARYTVDGKPYEARVFKLKHLGRSPVPTAGVDAVENLKKWIERRSTIVERFNARVCELCGSVDRPVEIHHVRKLADMKKSPLWVRLKSVRTRKRIILCVTCHDAVHAGRLPS